MRDLPIVYGSECLEYISKPVGFVDRIPFGKSVHNSYQYGNLNVRSKNPNPEVFHTRLDMYPTELSVGTHAQVWSHDTSKRVVGLVLGRTDDNGYHVVILGNDTVQNTDIKILSTSINVNGYMEYENPDPLSVELVSKTSEFQARFQYGTGNAFYVNTVDETLTIDDILDVPCVYKTNVQDYNLSNLEYYSGISNTMPLSTDKNRTLTFGTPEHSMGADSYILEELTVNPLDMACGDMYVACYNYYQKFGSLCPPAFIDGNYLYDWDGNVGLYINSGNGVAVPFNLILTNNEQYAINYVENGVLPPDAWLHPVEDWDNLPNYEPQEDDEPEEDDNTPDDTTRDITPNPPVIPSFTPTMLSNNNYYWLTVNELSAFISWYWNDIGAVQDIDDLLSKIEGLYNDLSQAIINIRFFPVEIGWIGGLGAKSNIKIAQIEKAGLVDTISRTPSETSTGKPIVRLIGNIHIPNKYNSFVDLSPYSQLSLYLPWHGFIDLDINFLSGHDLYVYGIYDYISGTIQYLLYYDNQFLINTIVSKMCIDIPVSLQTKNDRDSAIFQNVSNAVSGLIGAGMSLGSGNPMGLLVGANALNSGVSSAPLNVKGNVGEQGAYYAPPQCAIILRRPTISKDDSWKKSVGNMCAKGYTLNSGSLSGFTKVYNPRITFSGNTNADNVTIKPLQSEIDEIYTALEKGVIL